jgi:hypothetical protein
MILDSQCAYSFSVLAQESADLDVERRELVDSVEICVITARDQIEATGGSVAQAAISRSAAQAGKEFS